MVEQHISIQKSILTIHVCYSEQDPQIMYLSSMSSRVSLRLTFKLGIKWGINELWYHGSHLILGGPYEGNVVVFWDLFAFACYTRSPDLKHMAPMSQKYDLWIQASNSMLRLLLLIDPINVKHRTWTWEKYVKKRLRFAKLNCQPKTQKR